MEECKRQMSYSKIYRPLQKEEVDPLLVRIKVTLRKKHKKVWHSPFLSRQKVPSTKHWKLSFPCFYILSKIVKNPIVGRPILAGCNWNTRPASKYIAFHLQQYYKRFDTIITDRLDVLRFIETVELLAGCELSTIDVVSLYTNIPLDHFMEVIRKLLKDHPFPEAELLLDLLHFVLYNNLL